MLTLPATSHPGAMPPILFTSCSLKNAVAAEQGAAASDAGTSTKERRQVMVAGRRIKTIDVHCHCAIPEAMQIMGLKVEATRAEGIAEVGKQRIASMDRQGIDVEVLSINPYWYDTAKDLAAEVVRINNERLAEFCAANPERIAAFASVSLQYPELAVEEIEHAVRKLGLRGVAVGAACAGHEFSDPKFHLFWAKCEEMGILVFIHPQSTPELNKRFKGNGWLSNAIGNPLDTTICLAHLIFEGTLDRFPGLKLCSAHGGGYLPSYAARFDHSCRIRPDQCNPAIRLKKKPSEYLRDMYYDTLVFTPEALRHLTAEVGAGQLMIGTDHPIPWSPNPVDHILDTPGFTDEERIAMLGGTAARLLGL